MDATRVNDVVADIDDVIGCNVDLMIVDTVVDCAAMLLATVLRRENETDAVIDDTIFFKSDRTKRFVVVDCAVADFTN